MSVVVSADYSVFEHGAPVKAANITGLDVLAGDAEFFIADPACRLQLRKLLRSDMLPGELTSTANAILALRSESGELEGHAEIWMRPEHIRNSRAGVMRALDRVQQKGPEKARLLRAIADKQTVWGEADRPEDIGPRGPGSDLNARSSSKRAKRRRGGS